MYIIMFIDIVECADESNGGCEHNCTNTVGSFLCSCRDGFTLNSNQRTCDGKVCMSPDMQIARNYMQAD